MCKIHLYFLKSSIEYYTVDMYMFEESYVRIFLNPNENGQVFTRAWSCLFIYLNLFIHLFCRRHVATWKLSWTRAMSSPSSMPPVQPKPWATARYCDILSLFLSSLYAVKVRRHTPWSRGPLSWIPGMLVHALSISFATAQSSHNSEIYNIGAHAQ